MLSSPSTDAIPVLTGSYTPDQGKEKAANEALNGVYEAGLAEIKAKLAK